MNLWFIPSLSSVVDLFEAHIGVESQPR